MRTNLSARPAQAGVLCLAAAAVTGDATSASAQTPAEPRIALDATRAHATAGNAIAVRGRLLGAAPARRITFQIRRAGRWVAFDRATTDAEGRFALRQRFRRPLSGHARVIGADGATRSLGRVNVYRRAHASWYGPGLYGNRLGCGGRLSAGRLGVAHKTLPCGTRVTFRHRGRSVRVPVIDRGPYVGGREYDLTEATAQRLGFRGHGEILTTR